jgi:hypothetical protein
MNDKFDELAKGMAQSVTHTALLLAVTVQLAMPARANNFRLGPVFDLSDPDALAACGSNGRETEPYIAVNPTNQKNMVAAWFGGFSKAIVSAVSLDSGKHWQQIVVPGVTSCTGGKYGHAFDAWLAFASDGDLYLSCVVGESTGNNAVLVSKSTSGGLDWDRPVTIFETTDKHSQPDKPSITADPTDARFAYVIWDNCDNGNKGLALFSRTTDGGSTWEPTRAIYDAGVADHQAFANQIVVLPNGTLVDFFTEEKFVFDGSTSNDKQALLSLILSMDEGQAWSAPIRIAVAPLFVITDPETGHPVQSAARFAPLEVAVDQHNGNLYAVWEDTRFSNGQYGSIAFAMSIDGGLTWSAPIPVNKTPTSIPPGNRQAFLPTVAVASDGTIAVSYYDFRFNDSNPGLPTDYWLVHCHPSAATLATNPANWGGELRLTERSFDMETAATFGGPAYFVGDYESLASAGNDFVAAWTQPHDTDIDSILFRRVGP